MDSYPTCSLTEWWNSEWYKEWERIAKERVVDYKLPEGRWFYDNVNGEWVYIKYGDEVK